MGGGIHGGFRNTFGAKKQNTEINFKRVNFKGTVKVDGNKRDVSRRVYQRSDIDFNYIHIKTGKSNLDLMLEGKAPIGTDGRPIQLHHILQKESGPMVEIREVTHQEYKRTLHGLVENGGSFRNNKELEKQYKN